MRKTLRARKMSSTALWKSGNDAACSVSCEQLDIALDQLGKNIFVVAQLGEGLLHSVRRAQFAAHLFLNLPLELRETFVAQALGEAHDGRVADSYGLGEIVYVGEQQSGAVVLQIMAEPLLRPVERVDLGQNLFDGRHETFVSTIVVKFSCQATESIFHRADIDSAYSCSKLSTVFIRSRRITPRVDSHSGRALTSNWISQGGSSHGRTRKRIRSSSLRSVHDGQIQSLQKVDRVRRRADHRRRVRARMCARKSSNIGSAKIAKARFARSPIRWWPTPTSPRSRRERA